ncbi:response regulator [Chloroflexota bacterium]
MSKLILIIEDEPRNLRLIQDLLQVSGYSSIEATNGEIAVELAKANKPDLILMDIQMPVMDGLEATQILKADINTSHIPIIALSSYAMRGDKERILETGCDDYMSKPIDIKEFQKMVADYLPG